MKVLVVMNSHWLFNQEKEMEETPKGKEHAL